MKLLKTPHYHLITRPKFRGGEGLVRFGKKVKFDIFQAFSCPHPIPQLSSLSLKPYVKAVIPSERLEWCIISMVDCVTILLYCQTPVLGLGLGVDFTFSPCNKTTSTL